MTENADRPLVTFAVFAYNQEKYIRDAVEGAFSQTYEPLEIILSDDCSTDRTFEIMQEMLTNYKGPHDVRVRRSTGNAGTLAHLLGVASEANGAILVVAAGDDISLPERTTILSAQFASDEIAAVSSDDIVIDENGKERNWKKGRIENRDRWHDKNPTWVLGASAAYRSDLLKILPLPQKIILHEDTALQEVLAIYKKKSARLRKKLVRRRSHAGNISFKEKITSSIDQDEQASLARWKRIADVKMYCAEVALRAQNGCGGRRADRYRRSAQYLSLLSNWPNLSISERFALFFLAINQRGVRTCAPRLFGDRVFRALKDIKGVRRDD